MAPRCAAPTNQTSRGKPHGPVEVESQPPPDGRGTRGVRRRGIRHPARNERPCRHRNRRHPDRPERAPQRPARALVHAGREGPGDGAGADQRARRGAWPAGQAQAARRRLRHEEGGREREPPDRRRQGRGALRPGQHRHRRRGAADPGREEDSAGRRVHRLAGVARQTAPVLLHHDGELPRRSGADDPQPRHAATHPDRGAVGQEPVRPADAAGGGRACEGTRRHHRRESFARRRRQRRGRRPRRPWAPPSRRV